MEKLVVDIDKVLDAFELDEDETEAVHGYDKLQLQFEAEGGGAAGVAEGGGPAREGGGGGGGEWEHGALGAYGGGGGGSWSDSQLLQPVPCAPPEAPPPSSHGAGTLSLLGLDLSSEVRGAPDGQNDDKAGACGGAPVAASLPPGHLGSQLAFGGSGAAGVGCQPLWPMAAQLERSPVAGDVPLAAPPGPDEAGTAAEAPVVVEGHGVGDLDVVASRTIDVIPTGVPPDRGLSTPLENTRPDLVHVWQSAPADRAADSGGAPAGVEEVQWGDRVGDGVADRRGASVDAVDGAVGGGGGGVGGDMGRRLLPDLMSMKSSQEDSTSGADFSEPAVVMENVLAGPLPACNPQEPALVLENAVTGPPGPSSLPQPSDLVVALGMDQPPPGGAHPGDGDLMAGGGGGAAAAIGAPQGEDLSAYVCDNNPASVTHRLYAGPPQPSLPDVSAVCCPASAPGPDAGQVHFRMDGPDNEVDLYARLMELEEAEEEEEEEEPPAEAASMPAVAASDVVPATGSNVLESPGASASDTLGPDLIGVVSQQLAEAGWAQNLETISSIEAANISQPSSAPGREEEEKEESDVVVRRQGAKDLPGSSSTATTSSSSSSSSSSVSASSSPSKVPSQQTAESAEDEGVYQSLESLKTRSCETSSSSSEGKMTEGDESQQPQEEEEEEGGARTPPVSSLRSTSLSSLTGEAKKEEGAEGGARRGRGEQEEEGVGDGRLEDAQTHERTVDAPESPPGGGGDSDDRRVVDVCAGRSDDGDYNSVGVNIVGGSVAPQGSAFGNGIEGDGQSRDAVVEDEEEEEEEGAGEEGEGSSSESPSDQATNPVGRFAPYWIPDEEAPHCQECGHKFTVLRRRHHCRACGRVLCAPCCHHRAPLHYLDYKEARVCLPCLQLIHEGREEADNASPSGSSRGGGGRGGPKPPDPNNPMDYCSRVPPPQQAVPHAPPPTVMVPVGVLKREGSPDRCLIPADDRLPPVLMPGRSSESVSVGEADLEEQLFGEGLPVVFALNKNLTVLVKVVKMECCVGLEVWNVATRGLCTVGQEELVLLLELLPGERQPPKDIFAFFHTVYQQASQGKLVTELGHTIFTEPLLGSREHGGFLYVRPSFQCLHKLVLPPAPYLFALLIQKWEAPWAKVFPLRLLLRLGAEFRYYPCPLVSVRHRKPVFYEIGHTIMNLLVDFRNYMYTVPSVPGLVIHMAEKNTSVHLPRNRYNQVAKALSNSNDHVLALGANFSPQADSHLVTIEDEDGRYTTQAINIHNRPRRVTGASFIVFNGALKTTSGLSAKSSIVEDGLMVQIPADMMVRLREALRNMRDLDIPCGPVGLAAQHSDELISVRWMPDDKNFNVGIKSPIDSRIMDGIPSVKVTQAQDYAGQMNRIRCTEVFVIQGESSTGTSDVNLSRLSEVLARSFCTALTPHLQLLYAGDQGKLGLRATIHQDNVGYECGGCGERLPGVCMKDLDAELIPVIHRAAANLTSDHQPIVLELLFHIMQL
ncbi:smad anchor for receptor activation isoform X2 [Oratosquilla oratoria]|uniref:smad anchor for receptor activation isoform X2 n=1 Tax=Oratosquilla oratoria TaxID=337810 RepID=UPI003F76D931